MEKSYFSAKDIMNYSYCQRIVYYEHVLKIPQATTRKELKGREKYEDFRSKSKRNKIVKEFAKNLRKIFDVTLLSNKFEIITKTDCILINEKENEAFPVSIKYTRKPRAVYRTMKNQLLLEALLIEEQLGYKVNYGFIKFMLSGDIVKIRLNKREELLLIIQSLRTMIRKELLPERTRYEKRCIDCCYRKLCWVN